MSTSQLYQIRTGLSFCFHSNPENTNWNAPSVRWNRTFLTKIVYISQNENSPYTNRGMFDCYLSSIAYISGHSCWAHAKKWSISLGEMHSRTVSKNCIPAPISTITLTSKSRKKYIHLFTTLMLCLGRGCLIYDVPAKRSSRFEKWLVNLWQLDSTLPERRDHKLST